LREARLPLITRLLQFLGVRVLVSLHRRRPSGLPEARNDGRLLRLPASRRLTPMEGHPWFYTVACDSDANRALQKLREREFAAGRYNPAMRYLLFAGYSFD
jgi:hypothetical protein